MEIDEGKASASESTPATPVPRPSESSVYLWKRCCLKSHVAWMYNGHRRAPAEGSAGARYYVPNYLHDAATTSSTTFKSSALYRGGLVYTQVYNSVKEAWDAAKCIPFENEAMETLAQDPRIHWSISRKLDGGYRKDETVEQAYLQSKYY